MIPTRTDKPAILEALLICLGVVILGYCPEPSEGSRESGFQDPAPVTVPLPADTSGIGSRSGQKPSNSSQVTAKPHDNSGNVTVRDHRQAVVRVVVAEGPSTSRGSGVIVDCGGKTLCLTAWHVVRTNAVKNVPVIHFQDGTSSRGRVVASSDAWDVAAIECDRYGVTPVAIAAVAPKPGDRLTVTGYGPNPSRWRENTGAVTGFSRPTRQHSWDHIVINAGARQGDSGGPIFNAAGEVAGILWGSDGRDTYATHSGRLRKILDGNQPEKPDSSPGNGPNKLDRSPCAGGRCPKP